MQSPTTDADIRLRPGQWRPYLKTQNHSRVFIHEGTISGVRTKTNNIYSIKEGATEEFYDPVEDWCLHYQ